MNDMVLCPLVDRQIDIVDCMENQAIREEYIPEDYKKKNDWKMICEGCIYSRY